MRLRTRLILGLGVLAVVPLVLVVPSAISNLRHTLSDELNRQVQRSSSAAQATLRQSGTEARRAIEDLAASDALAQVAQDLLQRKNPAGVMSAAKTLMQARGLTVLSLLDESGTVLSSGHSPARIGDPDPVLAQVAKARPKEAVLVRVEVKSDGTLLQGRPAFVAAEPMEYGELKIWVVGGVLLDDALAARLADLTAARVEIVAGEGEVIAAAGGVDPPTRERVLELSPEVRLRLQFSQAPALRAERGVLTALATMVAVGLLCAVVVTFLLAPRITRPIEALTAGVRRIGQGELQVQVEEQGGGEVGELVRAFNRMTGDLRRTTEALVDSERIAAWQEVARRLAHEIKNPLTPIRMSLETLMAANQSHSPRFPELFQESAGAVLEEVDRLRRIVDEFSRFARLPKPVLARLELGELAGQVLSLYASPPPGIYITPTLEPGVQVEADRDQLTQVLVNLLKNAQDAMPSGGALKVRVRAEAGHAHLEVEDSGPGIRPEDRARIFEPYFTTKEGGTGLGLAIAARICQEHGGRLEVGGEVGRGALFSVVLPLRA